ncbi:sec14 cytosolic factor [Aristolochia californica]|uniref:sec14 cytosolic factor n=1 Tax=Aristolochia californica TaxID=171875 RepID=UPI0035E36522
MAKNQQEAIAQMRKSIEKLGSSAKKYGDATLLRFLIARSMDPMAAAKMFVEWQKWRDSFVPFGHIPANEVSDQLEARKVCLAGPTIDGHPILIVLASNHFPPKDFLQFKKFVVHLLDKTIASGVKESEVGDEKLVGVLDLQNISYRNIDARGLITGFQFLQAYYPERLAKLYMVNMPWIFVSVWNFVSRFLEKATLEKVVVVKNDEDRNDFVRAVGEANLPEEYGGKAKLVALQDVTINHWPLPVQA